MILDRLARLEEYVGILEGLRNADIDDAIQRGALERYLQLAAESCLDVGEMVVASAGLPRPDTYRGVLRGLTTAGVLDQDFGREFEAVAGLRNILVHDYTRVDAGRLLGFLGRLDDFRTFAHQVTTWLGTREGS